MLGFSSRIKAEGGTAGPGRIGTPKVVRIRFFLLGTGVHILAYNYEVPALETKEMLFTAYLRHYYK